MHKEACKDEGVLRYDRNNSRARISYDSFELMCGNCQRYRNSYAFAQLHLQALLDFIFKAAFFVFYFLCSCSHCFTAYLRPDVRP